MKKLIYMLFATAIIWQLQACDDENLNPCNGEEKAPTTFSMGTRFYIDSFDTKDTLIATDTVFDFQLVGFVAPVEYYYAEWKIGFDDRVFKGTEFSLRFPDLVNNLEIRMIGRRARNPCILNDDGVDTLYRYLTVKDRAGLFFGDYRGVLQNAPMDTFNVRFVDDPIRGIQSININRGCDFVKKNISAPIRISYKILYLGYSRDTYSYEVDGCKDPRGWARLDETGDILTIDYTIGSNKDINSERIPLKFIGKRIE
ncbi:MAG: hypothetical protein ACJAWV_001304 [Flammeovirgaceae bacterium]|jgi:hypothetical protein